MTAAWQEPGSPSDDVDAARRPHAQRCGNPKFRGPRRHGAAAKLSHFPGSSEGS